MQRAPLGFSPLNNELAFAIKLVWMIQDKIRCEGPSIAVLRSVLVV